MVDRSTGEFVPDASVVGPFHVATSSTRREICVIGAICGTALNRTLDDESTDALAAAISSHRKPRRGFASELRNPWVG